MKKMFKKVLVFLMIVCLSFSMVSCENSTEKEQQITAAKEAYCDLKDAHETCEAVMDSIYGAWHFSIYEYDNYSRNEGFEKFCESANVSVSELSKTFRAYYARENMGIASMYSMLADFSVALKFINLLYQNNGTFEDIQQSLDDAKAILKTLPAEYADYTGFETLKKYYIEVSGYYEFCQKPEGSFEQLQIAVETYRRELRSYKIDLSFTLE